MICMLADSVKGIEDRLRNRHQELQQRLRAVTADLNRETEPLNADFAEQATQRENDEVLEAIRATTEDEMRQVRAALERVEAGTYGLCLDCRHPIEPSRLQAVPYTERCMLCADPPRQTVNVPGG